MIELVFKISIRYIVDKNQYSQFSGNSRQLISCHFIMYVYVYAYAYVYEYAYVCVHVYVYMDMLD
jgi:hypothetical protein